MEDNIISLLQIISQDLSYFVFFLKMTFDRFVCYKFLEYVQSTQVYLLVFLFVKPISYLIHYSPLISSWGSVQ